MAVAAVIVALLLGPAAGAQTTSSTSTTALPSPPAPRPPDAFLASGSGEVKGDIQMFCWSEPPLALCADRFDPIDPANALTVQAGASLTLRFDRPISPTGITVLRSDRPAFPFPTTARLDVPSGNPTQFILDVPPGTYFLSIVTDWAQGDATYVFEVDVVPTTTTTTIGDPAGRCDGRTATLVGTDGRDTIYGTLGVDVILGRRGNDLIVGLGGDDVVCGGDGADAVVGGEGSDRLLGEAGDDQLVGQNGDDALVGGPGADRVVGGRGADSLEGGAGVDLCIGNAGTDTSSACERTFGVP